VAAYLETLDKVEKMEAPVFVPAHADAGNDLGDLIRFNREKVQEIAQLILAVCSSPLNFESVLQKIFDHYALTMNMQQYVLVGSTIKSYLAWLKDSGKISTEIRDNMVLWKTI